MKRMVKAFLFFLLVFLFSQGRVEEAKAGSLTVRGVWVSCFEYEEAGLAKKTEVEFRLNADRLFQNIKANGCNTVYFHVRAYDDAIYPSSVTGWSKHLTGDGKALSYDPLKILVSCSHKYGIKFHAWMNPYRLTAKKTLNPGKASTTKRIVKQVREILNHYPVDGIHFDDYFYTDEKKYKKVSEAERKKNVNAMVRAVYKEVKKKAGKKFGISPAGDVSYCDKIGADVRTWMSQQGYVDYMAPQLYWSDNYLMNGKKKTLFQSRLAKWRNLNKRDIPMYIGLAAYKAGTVMKDDRGWSRSSSNLASQVKQIRAGNSEGYILFGYSDLYRKEAKREITALLKQIAKIKVSHSVKTMRKGKRFRWKVTVKPSRLTSGLTFSSSDKKKASVSKKGVVRAKKRGKIKLYVRCGGKVKTCILTIK